MDKPRATFATVADQDSFLLGIAIQQAQEFLQSIPVPATRLIVQELFFTAWDIFRQNDRQLSSLRIQEVADLEFELLANGHATGTLLIKTKGKGSQPAVENSQRKGATKA